MLIRVAEDENILDLLDAGEMVFLSDVEFSFLRVRGCIKTIDGISYVVGSYSDIMTPTEGEILDAGLLFYKFIDVDSVLNRRV